MIHEKITDDNFLVYCAKVYDNPQMTKSDEFLEDLVRINHRKSFSI